MNYLLNITINQNKTGVSHIEKKSLTIATLFLYLIYTAIPSVTELVEVPEGFVIYKCTPKQKTEKGVNCSFMERKVTKGFNYNTNEQRN